MAKAITIERANSIAAGRVIVSVDPIANDLWRVEDDDMAEIHEPMNAMKWRRFLRQWGE